MARRGSIIDSIGRASLDLIDDKKAYSWNSTATFQRMVVRQVKNGFISRLSIPSLDNSYGKYSEYPTVKAENIGSDAFPFGIYDIGENQTRIVNFSGIERVLITNNGQKITLTPFETINLEYVTFVQDQFGFEAFLPNNDSGKEIIMQCIVADGKYARIDPSVSPDSYWGRVILPIANKCTFPVNFIVIAPSYNGGFRFDEIDLDPTFLYLPSRAKLELVYTIFGAGWFELKKGTLGFPVEISSRGDEVVFLFTAFLGEKKFLPFDVLFPSISR